MIVQDLYTRLMAAFDETNRKDLSSALASNENLKELQVMAEEWGQDVHNIQRWMASPEYIPQQAVAERFIARYPEFLARIEKTLATKLQGELRLSPSLMLFDGFARYDSGSHTVWFGIDHPDANDEYLQVLLAHELSHVYRDHQPRVWAHLGKPIAQISRQEYLDSMTGEEHLVSEGLATLFSQVMVPEVPIHIHHYYFREEMQWCIEHVGQIEKVIRERLKLDGDVWKFYEENAVAPGSPSRTQYFWAALKIAEWLQVKLPSTSLKEAVIRAHGWPATEFQCFK